MARKMAVFIHGYGGSTRQWWVQNGPLVSIFEQHGYEAFIPELLGEFRLIDRDFRNKSIHGQAAHIGALISMENDCETIDELVFVAYEVGGLIVRYLAKHLGDNIWPKQYADFFLSMKEKLKQVITIATPNHGTLPKLHDLAKTEWCYDSLWATDPIFKSLEPGSNFLTGLNTPTETVPGIDWHSIWCRHDLKVTPAVTAVLDGAKNYSIDSAQVNHTNILWRSETRDIVRDILEGRNHPSGLQNYPPTHGCGIGSYHAWFPDADSHIDYRWSCKNVHNNKKCSKIVYSKWWPHNPGCEVGMMDPDMYQHSWRRTGYKTYYCVKCNRKTDKCRSKPKASASPTCNVRPLPQYHRWHIKQQLWECANCKQSSWSRYRPALLGCSKGIIKKRLHSWVRGEQREFYFFRCYNRNGSHSCDASTWWPSKG